MEILVSRCTTSTCGWWRKGNKENQVDGIAAKALSDSDDGYTMTCATFAN